jgi:hypothetical protein
MEPTLKEILASYNATAALPDAHTIPASWYTDARVAQLELHNVFSRDASRKTGTIRHRERCRRASGRRAWQRRKAARVL